MQRVKRIEDHNQDFHYLTNLLGERLAERTYHLQQRSDVLQNLTTTLIQLAEERIHQQSAIQRRQNVILESLLGLVTHGLPDVPEVEKRRMRPDDVHEYWRKVADEDEKLMQESMEGRRKVLHMLRSRSQPLDILRQSKAMDDAEDLESMNVRTLIGQARGMLNERLEASMEISEDEADNSGDARVIKAEVDDDHPDLTGDFDVPAGVVGQTFHLDEEVPVPETELDATSSMDTSEVGTSGAVDSPIEQHDPPVVAAEISSTTEVPPAPIVNLVSATPMNSQDTAAGTITTLHVPNPDVLTSNPDVLPPALAPQLLPSSNMTSTSLQAHADPPAPQQRRGRSRTPIPPITMVTRSRSKGKSPE